MPNWADKWLNDRERKLPKWAQAELARALRDLNEQRRKVATLYGEEPTGVAWLDYDGSEEVAHPLPARTTVRLGRFEVDIRNGVLAVRSVSQGIAIEPHASNAVHVHLKEW